MKKIIRFIAVTSSQIASTSVALTDSIKDKKIDLNNVESVVAEKQMIESVKKMIDEDEDIGKVVVQSNNTDTEKPDESEDGNVVPEADTANSGPIVLPAGDDIGDDIFE